MKAHQPKPEQPEYMPGVLSVSSAVRKLDLLATLATAPWQSAESLALHLQVSIPTMRRDLSWLVSRGLALSYRGGASPKRLWYLSRDGLVFLTGLQRVSVTPAGATGRERPLPRRNSLGQQQYHRQLLRMVPRLPHYVQLQELGDWLAMIGREHPSVGAESIGEEIHTTLTSWQWLRDARLGLSYHGRRTICALDALAIATLDRRGPGQCTATALLCCYLDEGAASLFQLSRRLRQLLRFRHEHGISAEDFPLVLIRTPSRHRAWQWARAVAQSADWLGLEPLRGLLLFPAVSPTRHQAHWDLTPAPTPALEPTWPFIVDGLPAGPTAEMVSARELSWQPFMAEPHLNVALWTPLASRLFQPQDPDIVHTCAQALQLAGHNHTVTYQVGRRPISSLRARQLLLSHNLGAPRARQPGPSLSTPTYRRPGSLPAAEPTPPRTEGTQVRYRHDAAPGWDAFTPRGRLGLLTELCARLGRRHLALLALIAAHPLISQVDLASVTQLQPRSLAPRLRRLRDLGLIEVVVLSASSTGFPSVGWRQYPCESSLAAPVSYAPLRCLRLLELGSHLVAAVYNLPVISSPFPQRTARIATSHDTGIRRFLGLLIEQTREYASAPEPAAPLPAWDRQLVWWSNAPAVRLRFPAEGEMVTLLPDAAGELRFQATSRQFPIEEEPGHSILVRRFWLEWDAGTENTRDLWDKLAGYQSYARSQESSAPERVLPALLIVAPEERQEQRMLRIMTELAARRPALPEPPVAWATSREPPAALTRQGAGRASGIADRRTVWWQAQPQCWSGCVEQGSGVGLPVWVTTTHKLGTCGPLGRCWLGVVL